MRGFINSYPKAQSIENQNKFVLRKFMRKYKLVLINLLREYQMTKVSTRIIFHNGSVNLDCHLSNQDDNKTYTYINNITKDQIIKVHKV